MHYFKLLNIKGVISLIISIIVLSCGDSNTKRYESDSPKSGRINISVDETFKPIIEEELKLYHATFPNSKILVEYKSEADCFRDLKLDNTRMVIVAKGLSEEEANYYKSYLTFFPSFQIVAYDAVVVLLNSENSDSTYTINRLSDILTGKLDVTAVMDGKNATSTVRFLNDSVMHKQPFGKNVVSAGGSQEVIDYVANNKGAIGFVGSSWIGNVYEPKQQELLKHVKLALVECKTCEEKDMFAKPSQATITYMQYPLARPLFYILKENYPGLGTGFINFMELERGQLIFRRSCLAPAKMNLLKRYTKIKEEE